MYNYLWQVVSDSHDSALYFVKGDGTHTAISSSDLTMMVKFVGITDAGALVADNFADFS